MQNYLCATGAPLRRSMIEAAEAALASGDRAAFDQGRSAYVEHVKQCRDCGSVRGVRPAPARDEEPE